MTAPKSAPASAPSPRTAAAPDTPPDAIEDVTGECPLCAEHGGPERAPNAQTLAAMRDARARKNLTHHSSFSEMIQGQSAV